MFKLISEPVKYSGYQFAIFRICLGLYLLIYFLYLYPYVGDLYAANGMFSFHPPIPFLGLEFMWAERSHGQVFLLIFAICAAFFTLGFQRRILALVLWFGWTSLLLRLPFFSIPSESFVGWLILANVAIPGGEPWALAKRNPEWQLPAPLYWGAWAILGLGYSISGYDKLQSVSWQNGTALRLAFESPVAVPSLLKNWILQTPPWVLQTATWAAMALEILSAPLILFKATRKWAWLTMVIMHISILIFLAVDSVSYGMLLVHLFVFNPSWVSRWSYLKRTPQALA